MSHISTNLPDDPALQQKMLRAAIAENERQRLIIAALQRNRFGRRSEKFGEATVLLEVRTRRCILRTLGANGLGTQAARSDGGCGSGRSCPFVRPINDGNLTAGL
jgi:hypothetical protein